MSEYTYQNLLKLVNDALKESQSFKLLYKVKNKTTKKPKKKGWGK